MLRHISPIDGRYAAKTIAFQDYFSEYALIKYRVYVEVKYLIQLLTCKSDSLPKLAEEEIEKINSIYENFTEAAAQTIKDTEKVTNHDVKAVEYYIKDKMQQLGLAKYTEWVHFGLTSQDVNNTATPLMLRDAIADVYYPMISEVREAIKLKAEEYQHIPLLAHTHGQPASPTTMGKEWMVFVERLQAQIQVLIDIPTKAKFGGATGNFNAHKVTIADVDWIDFGNTFVESLGMERLQYTTQIEHYDMMAHIFHTMSRINTILVDFCRDLWTYISMEYFKQKVIAGEVGSSAMPHKVNPIDFENAEGNLGLANAIFTFLAGKLPISRLQRDLTDSTVSRNIGVPFAHSGIACGSILKGIGKLQINTAKIQSDLDKQWPVVAEAIQNILRREGVEKPYEKLKDLTRGNQAINKETMHAFINGLDITDSIKAEMLLITPLNYIGYKLADYQ